MELPTKIKPSILYIRLSEDVHESFDGNNNRVVDMVRDMIEGENVKLFKVFHAIILVILAEL